MNPSVDGRRPLRWVLVPVILVAVAAMMVGASLYFSAASPQYYGWPWVPFGWLLFIPLFFAGFFALRFLFWSWWRGWGWYHGEDSAMQVLRERFARGELTKEQFEQMRKELARS